MEIERIMSSVGSNLHLLYHPGRGRGKDSVDDVSREIGGMIVGRSWLGKLRKFVQQLFPSRWEKRRFRNGRRLREGSQPFVFRGFSVRVPRKGIVPTRENPRGRKVEVAGDHNMMLQWIRTRCIDQRTNLRKSFVKVRAFEIVVVDDSPAELKSSRKLRKMREWEHIPRIRRCQL
jgi:hypothetical protein